MQGFIGDKIGDCKLWLLFCDADWAGEYDSKSTSGCALYPKAPRLKKSISECKINRKLNFDKNQSANQD